MIIFDGYARAAERELQLRDRVREFVSRTGRKIRVAAILFTEDTGSQLYTRLKKEAAERVGIEYQVYPFSFSDPLDEILGQIQVVSADPRVTGIIVQKPWRKTWLTVLQAAGAEMTPEDFRTWWLQLVSAIEPTKDVDGLHPATHAAIQAGTWEQQGKVLPATVRATLHILEEAGGGELPQGKYAVIGKSDLLGKPLAAVLKHEGREVVLMGKNDLELQVAQPEQLQECRVVISSTGQENLIQGKWLADQVILVDVGEPKGDVDRTQLDEARVAFLTPVPGGVGPMTVVSLLENALELSNVG